jgi:AhpD family alkylhydroperoxidase
METVRMAQRIDYARLAASGIEALEALQSHVDGSGLDHALLELVKTRASQLNACAYCIDMHTKDARIDGESEQRLYGLSAWREAPYYSERERAALAWTEAVTRIHGDIGDELFEPLRAHFSDKEIVDLTLAVVAINSWNRLAIGFRTPPGSYRP